MKKKIVTVIIFITTATSAYTIGRSNCDVVTETVTEYTIPDGYINTKSETFINDYVNMNEIIDFETSENGLIIYTSDGSGYYWER